MARTSAQDRANKRVLRVFMVELKVDMPDTPPITFFGSKKAIFEYFGNKTLRISYNYCRDLRLAEKPFENAICRIAEGPLYTLACQEIVDRRERENRDPIPVRNQKGADKLNAKKMANNDE